MKKMNLFAALAVVATTLAPSVPAAARAGGGNTKCHTLNAAKLDAHFAQFNAAWETKNPDTVTALFDDDALLLATVANTPRTDPGGVRDYFVKFLKGSPVARIDSSTIKTGCNWALRAGTWTVTLTDAATGAKSDVKARYSFLYQYEDGKWKIEHLHSSVMPEKAPA